jgi:Type I phosphodiesterase / nucleotide pyrophosphatase
VAPVPRILLLGLVVAASCTGIAAERSEDRPTSPESSESSNEPRRDDQRTSCGLPRSQLVRVWRGYHPARSGEIQLIPKEPHVIGTGFQHSGPWGYLQQVPMLWYGPGFVPAVGAVSRPATMADVAPTVARFLDFELTAPDGHPMTEALLPPDERTGRPKLIVVVVWDGGGRNVLAEYPDAWPVLDRLIPRGAWFERFTVGSSPSVTPAIHATLGTGAFPRRHGMVDLHVRLGTRLARPEANWPEVSTIPTLTDLYDRANDNRPKIAVVATHPWHLTMIGTGATFPGGDKDLAILKTEGRWGLYSKFRALYETRTYPNGVPGLDAAIRRMDVADGRRDGVWLDADFVERPDLLVRTPAYIEWQTRIIDQVIQREELGADATPDVLFTNYKQIDLVGHLWSMNSPNMRSVLRASDEALGDLVRILNREVGRGAWVLALTADHGVTPRPSTSGAVFMPPVTITDDISAVFDDADGQDVVEALRPTEMWVEETELRENGFTLNDVARFISGYTRGQLDAAGLTAEQRNEKMFSLAIPGSGLERMPCLAAPGR